MSLSDRFDRGIEPTHFDEARNANLLGDTERGQAREAAEKILEILRIGKPTININRNRARMKDSRTPERQRQPEGRLRSLGNRVLGRADRDRVPFPTVMGEALRLRQLGLDINGNPLPVRTPHTTAPSQPVQERNLPGETPAQQAANARLLGEALARGAQPRGIEPRDRGLERELDKNGHPRVKRGRDGRDERGQERVRRQ